MSAGDSRPAAVASPFRALRHHNFRLYFAGQCVSLLGTWIQQVALSWLVYRLTGSTLLLGTVAFLTQAPQLVVGPFAGIWIDHADRRRLMLLIQSLMLAQAALLAVLSCAALYLASRRSVRGLTGTIAGGNVLSALALVGFSMATELWLGIVLLFFAGFGLIVCNAATNTILQTILPDHLRGRVLSLFTSAVLGMAAVGGLLAGIVAEHAGAWPTLLSMAALLLLTAMQFGRRLGQLQQHTRDLYAKLGIPRHDKPPAG